MDAIFQALITTIISGGPGAVVAILIAIIIALLWERRRLFSELERKDQKIDKIIEDYYKGTITLTDALNSLKNVLYEIKGKIL